MQLRLPMIKTLERINRAALRFLEPLSPEELYPIILSEAIELVKADQGSLFLWKDNRLQKVYASSPQIMTIKNRKRGLSYQAFKANKSFIADATPLQKIHPAIRKLGIKSTIFIPLSYRKVSIGILGLLSKKKHHFSESQLKILELFGSMASLAIKKNQLYVETKKALELRDQFIALAAHELRTPLTAAHGYSELLYRKVGNLSGSTQKWVQGLYPEMIRLKNLVKELLDINRIKSGQFEYILKECYLSEIVQRSIDNLHFRYPKKIVTFNSSIPAKDTRVIGDYDKLLQVSNNLLDNAAKYSEENSRIEIFLKKRNGFLNLSVKDQGIGISKKELPKVFDSFYKGEDNQKEGIGIGLHLSKHIIDYHHGTIALKSKNNKGTTAEVKLPGVKYEIA